jgi:hypothetical protein
MKIVVRAVRTWEGDHVEKYFKTNFSSEHLSGKHRFACRGARTNNSNSNSNKANQRYTAKTEQFEGKEDSCGSHRSRAVNNGASTHR